MLALRLVPIVALLVAWSWLGRAKGLKGDIFPSLGSVWSAMVKMITNGDYFHHLVLTGQEFAVAFAIAVVAGILAGVLVGSTRRSTMVFEPLFLLAYSLPRIALFPIFLTVFGIGMRSKVALGAINGFFPVFVNTLAGMKGMNPLHFAVARSLNATRLQRYTKVALRSIFGPVVTGVRMGVSLTILGVLVGEIIQSERGVGFFIFDRYKFFDFASMYGAIVITVAIVYVINVGLNQVERRLLRWRG